MILSFSQCCPSRIGRTCIGVLTAFAALQPLTVLAQNTVTSKAGEFDWGNGAAWEGGNVPAAGDNVIIAAGSTVTAGENRTVNNLTVAPGANLLEGFGNEYSITAAGDINIAGFMDPKSINATGNVTIAATGQVQSAKTITAGGTVTIAAGGKVRVENTDGTKIEAAGNVTVDGDVAPGTGSGSRAPTGKNGPPVTIKSTGGNVIINGSVQGVTGGGTNVGSGQPGKNGGPVIIEATADGMGIRGTGRVIGGAPGQGEGGEGEKGKTTLKGKKDQWEGQQMSIQGGDLEFVSAERIGFADISTHAILAEGGSITLSTFIGGIVDFRGVSAPDVLLATDSIIINSDFVLLDPAVTLADLTSPNAIVGPSIPEPATLTLLWCGTLPLLLWRKRRCSL